MVRLRLIFVVALSVFVWQQEGLAQEYIRVAGTKDKNHIELVALEDYVKGVLTHEASHYWPMEALKAQAVVCRTYALYEKKNSAGRSFDVRRDIFSQVYAAKAPRRYRIERAVEETKAQVLTFNDAIFPAYFHSTCAGHTEDVSVLWDLDIKPLKGVSCRYCQHSPHISWQAIIPLQELKAALNKSGYAVGKILNIYPGKNNASGRLSEIVVEDQGKETVIPVKDFRQSIGPNLIRSARFDVSAQDSKALFRGRGWGHGVGLCQWGAYFMAKEGASYRDILRYYYPGTRIK